MSDIQEEPTQKMSLEEWLATRVEAGTHIDPDTAEVDWEYGDPGDPYRVYPDRPAEARCIGRVRFARAPGTDIWVAFEDLPSEVCKRLWENIDAGRVTSLNPLPWNFTVSG